MHNHRSKIAIRSLIKQHQQILLDGGTYAFSQQYKRFIMNRILLLKLFHLSETDQNILCISQYPLSPAFDINHYIGDEPICKHLALRIMENYHHGIRNGSKNAKRYGKSWNLVEQVDWVYTALLELVKSREGSQNQ